MKRLVLATAAALLFTQSAGAQPRYNESYPYYGVPRLRYAPPPQYQRGPTPLDFLGAFLGAIPIQPQPYAAPCRVPQTTQYDPRDPNLYLEEKRVTKQEVEDAMRIFCSEHGSMMICLKIERMMREGR
jgi:hypothetical protein